MALTKLIRTALCLGLLLLVPCWLPAQSALEYQNRGDRYEGVRPKPVSGFDIEVISVLADYKDSTNQVPEHLRVKFYLKNQKPVYVTVREQDYRLFYWMDKAKPMRGWEVGWRNDFRWPTAPVLKQLDAKLNIYDLGVLVRLGYDTPRSVEEIAPAILYHSLLPDAVDAYLFTLKTNGDTRLSCSVYREGEAPAIMTQAFRRVPGGRPFTVRWDAQGAGEGGYTLCCKGYFLDTNQPVHQTVRFYHRPTVK
jgi:hypothetical protein